MPLRLVRFVVAFVLLGAGVGLFVASSATGAPGPAFVAAPASLLAQCRATAKSVGYAVPCPMSIPRGLVPTPGIRCRNKIVGLSCGNGWRDWVVGSGDVYGVPSQRLVITAAPRVVRSYAQMVNGPAFFRGQRVEVGGWVTVNGWRARWIFVPPATNEGSSFMGHHVLVWTTGGHTYAVGFHETTTRAVARAMDLELVRSIKLVGP